MSFFKIRLSILKKLLDLQVISQNAGVKKQRQAKNLLDRRIKHKTEVLA